MNCEDADLKAMASTRETLRKDDADLDSLVGSNTINAAEKRAKAVALQRDAEKTRAEESSHKAEILKAVEDADFECEEVEKLRNSIHDLTTTQEKDTTDLKLKLEDEENNISAMEAEIARSLAELASINTQSAEHRESERVKNDKLLKEIAGAKRTADMVKTAYERAQNNANSFSAIPDGELALQMKIMDESEQQVVDNANRERDEIVEGELCYVINAYVDGDVENHLSAITHFITIAAEPLLEKLKLDFNSDVSVEEQKEAGMNCLRRHCLDYLETAKIERQVRMEHAMDAYLEGVRLHEQEELQRRKEEEVRLAKIEEESRLAAEAHLREKEEEDEEEVRSNDWRGTHFSSNEISSFSSIIHRSHRRRGAAKKKGLHLLSLPRMHGRKTRSDAARSDVPLPMQLRFSARRRKRPKRNVVVRRRRPRQLRLSAGRRRKPKRNVVVRRRRRWWVFLIAAICVKSYSCGL